jgi:DNA polymerase-3 subunit gamma/tau
MSQVLALKYRPKRFEDLIGQSTISQTLSLALDSKRLSHAYLLSGLRGSGKTSTARILAKSFLCEQGPTSTPCEVCDNCVSANEGKHLDIIEMDAASNRGIDDIKELIEHIKYKPSSAQYKVFIIDEIHMLTTQAFNAFLKTLEEPPDFVKFILATTDPLKLPATILSRTQHFRFNKIAHKDVVNHLIHILNLENITFEEEALDILARSGQGSLRDTLTMLDQAIIFSKNNITTTAVVDMLGLLDPKVLDEIFNIILTQGDIKEVMHMLGNFEATLIIDEMTIYLKQKMMQNDLKFNILLFDRFFRILADAKQLLYLNSDNEFVLLLTFSKMVEAANLKTIEQIINEVHDVKTIEPKVVQPQVPQYIEPQQTLETNDEKQEELEQNSVIIEADFGNVQVDVEVDTIVDTNNDELIVEGNQPTQYEKLISKVYDRNYELGVCFENNFKYLSFENNILKIASSAQGECKNMLWKNFAFIRQFSEDIFGENIDIQFEKVEPVVKEEEQKKNNLDDSNASGSSCMQNTIATDPKQMKDAQFEYEIDDIEKSQMFNNAKELFKPTKIVVTSKS